MIQQLDAARSRVVRRVSDAGCRFAAPPQGLFGWVDTGVDTEKLAHQLAADGGLVVPGHLFEAMPKASSLMRVNFASAQDAHFWLAFVSTRQSISSVNRG